MAAAIFAVNHRRRREAAKHVALFLGVFAVFALPYVGYLYHETGQVRFEAKTQDGLRYATRLAKGMSIGEVYFGIDSNLVENGNSNTSDLHQIQDTHVPFLQRARIVAGQAVRNLPALLRGLSGLQIGQPVLGVLLGLGLFAVPWDSVRAQSETPLLCTVAFTLLTFGTWPFYHDRFLFPLLTPCILWSARGLHHLEGIVRETATPLAPSWVTATSSLVVIACVAALCLAASIGVRSSDELSLAWSPLRFEKPVGKWLHDHSRGARARVMDTQPTAAFYGGAALVRYPWCDAATALRYVEHKDVDYVLLRDSDEGRRPYIDEWLRNPPGNFALRASFPGEVGTIRVYGHSSAPPGDFPSP
jgi:hypothetical protein